MEVRAPRSRSITLGFIIKHRRRQELICEMIGPRPDRKRLRVPWLGDWQQRRMGIQAGPPLPEEIKTLAQSFRDKIKRLRSYSMSIQRTATRETSAWE